METTTIMNSAALRKGFLSLNESDLVSQAQKGDLESFNQIVLLYQDKIFGLTVRILGDEDTAEDITQNVFLAAYRSLPGFRNGSFRAWLYRIATNACYDELRRRKSHLSVSLDEDESEERFIPLYDLPGHILPEVEYDRRALEQVIQQAFSGLDADRRAVIVLVDLQDCDYQEAAQILGVPVGTVRSRLSRARRQMRHLLSAAGDDRLK